MNNKFLVENNDDILLSLIKNGDKQGLEKLFDKFYRPLVMYAYKFTARKEDAEDIVQEVFIKLWETKNYLNVNTSLRYYMYQSVKNSCLNWLKNKPKINTETIENTLEINDETMLDENDWNEYVDDVYKKIDDLPVRTKEIFKSVILENKKYKETADDLGVSVNTVKTALSRALDTLRNGMKKGVNQLFFTFL